MTKGIVPSLILFLAVAVAAVPWALPAAASFILPLLLIIFIFALTTQRNRELPAVSVFAAGLLMDVLTAGPLGYWAIIFLLTHTLASVYSRRARQKRFGNLWLAFAVTAAVAAFSGWAIASIYFVRVIDWQPMFIGGAVAIALFPLMVWPLRRPLGLVPAGPPARRG
ncbi:rod shape-determining protein MreD [bacterium BMS3Bbin10]|nr:rod shape-determining protein MreD [bacterium BMS3Bbin10]